MRDDDLLPADLWDADAARAYDTPGTGRFAPEVLGPAVDRLVELADGGPALELAVGTGRVALPLVRRGVPVTGIELSPAMVEVLRTKVGAAALPVVLGDMATARAPGRFALVYLVDNTISNLLTQDAQVACFRNAARHLGPGGRFVVELWVPTLRTLPPGRDADVWGHEPGYLGVDTYDVRRGAADRLAPRPVRRGRRGARVPHAAPLRLALGARPHGSAGRVRDREPARGLGGHPVHRGVAVARLRVPAPAPAVTVVSPRRSHVSGYRLPPRP